jgi:serine phosphatase RsbU (regulator of sigma subunit)
MASLAERIGHHYGPAAIGFDMLFVEPDPVSPAQLLQLYPQISEPAQQELQALPSMDRVFASVLGRQPTVLARAGIAAGSPDFTDLDAPEARILPVEAQFADPLPDGVLGFDKVLASLAMLDEVALGHGLVNGPPDPDGVIRRVPLVATAAGRPMPSLSLELARIALGVEEIAPLVVDGRLRGVRLGDRTIPTDPDGRMRLHFGLWRPNPANLAQGTVATPKAWPGPNTESAVDLFRQGFAPAAAGNAVVLVGETAAGTADVVAVPTLAETVGVRVQAQAVDAILSGGWLSRPHWALPGEWSLGLALAVAAVLVLPGYAPIAAFAGAAAALLLVALGSYAAFLHGQLLLDPVRPTLLGGGVAAVVLAGVLLETERVRSRLRIALVQERVDAAAVAGELSAAREIQLGMVPGRDALARLPAAVDVDAVLEPARSVGGDFYDAFALGDGRIVFLVADVTGKGPSAALFMAVSKALAKSLLLRSDGDLERTLDALGDELQRDNAGDMSVTMLLGVLEPDSGRLQLCNAGHEDPLLVRADGSRDWLRLDGGPPLCTLDGFPYPVEVRQLAPGDGLVAISDGVTEAQNAAGELFGRDRVGAVLDGWHGDATAQQAVARLVTAVRAFEADTEPSDDLTVLALRLRVAPPAA